MTEERSIPNHSNTRAVDPFDFQVAHKRLMMMFRISAMTNVVLVFAVTALVALILTILPRLKEVKVALITADSIENQVYRVEPISPETNGFEIVVETVASGFVQNALTINPLSIDDRLNAAKAVMTDEYFKKFNATFIDNDWLKEVMDSDLIRTIHIESTSHIQSGVSSHRLMSIDYLQVDKRGVTELGRKRMRAYLKIVLNPQQVSKSEIYRNPLGVFVLDMTTQEIEIIKG